MIASSMTCMSGIALPRRIAISAVITIFAPAPVIRWLRAAAPYPPNTTEWTAPIRVHASMAMICSGMTGM